MNKEVKKILCSNTKDELEADTYYWQELYSEIENCIACDLAKSRQQVVIGRGNRQAPCLILGEAPGATEDDRGLPFVGRSGKLLDEVLADAGISSTDYYITNIVKCRPPKNRRPSVKEVISCNQHLLKQIDLLQVKCILTLGSTAYEWCMQEKKAMLEVRGKWLKNTCFGIPLLPSVHPSYVLRSPSKKYLLMEDLCKIKSFLDEVKVSNEN